MKKPFRSYMFSVAAVALALPPVAGPPGAPSAKPFEYLGACQIEPDEWTDGDSFRVRLRDGRIETFRLYFVDTTESRSRGKRSDEQAAYFGITHEQAIELGKQAKTFTARAIAQPFTVYTRWRLVFVGSRFYAVVLTSDGQDLAELLVRAGLARIYGTRTPLPEGRDSRTYLRHLRQLEAEAKAQKVAGWGIVRPRSIGRPSRQSGEAGLVLGIF